MIISIIAAVAKNNVIGNKNSLPWHLPADMKHFKETTMGHCLIMGQNTHQSIGRPLPGRTNIVLTFDEDYNSKGCTVVTSTDEALRVASAKDEKEVFIIGGASIYKQFFEIADKLYITKINKSFKGDVSFPEIDSKKWRLVTCERHSKSRDNPYYYSFNIFEKIKNK